MTKTGVIICGHGSRNQEAVRQFGALKDLLADRFPEYPVEYGFLEFATPIIRTGLDKLVEMGVDHILAVPGMLFEAGHVKNDIASVLNEYGAGVADKGITIEYGRALGIDPKMLKAAGGRIEEAEAAEDGKISRADTLLMVVGRGTTDSDANGNVSKIARMLWEGLGYGWGEVCYSGVTFPLVAPGLEHAAKLGYKRIIVFPYFLFTGVLVERIYSITDEVAAKIPEVEFVKAGYLNDHVEVINTFEERIRGILSGDINMNCQLCKYREQVIGFEAHQGLPQMSHHHHVEGIGTGDSEPPDHSPDHAHKHAPHPHADHPHGPGKRNPAAVD